MTSAISHTMPTANPVVTEKKWIAEFSTKKIDKNLVPFENTALKIALFVPYLILEGMKQVANLFIRAANSIHSKLAEREVEVAPTAAEVKPPVVAETAPVVAAPVASKAEPVKVENEVEVDINTAMTTLEADEGEPASPIVAEAPAHSNWLAVSALAGTAALFIIGGLLINKYGMPTVAMPDIRSHLPAWPWSANATANASVNATVVANATAKATPIPVVDVNATATPAPVVNASATPTPTPVVNASGATPVVPPVRLV
jgi:hypothetical protein